MSFDDALAFLLSLVGEQVEVAVESPASGLIANFSGTLAQAHELTGRQDVGPMFFSFSDGRSGFVMTQAAFARASRAADGSFIRIEDRSGVAVVIDRGEPLIGYGGAA